MKIDLNTYLEKHANCVNALDSNKTCDTCIHNKKSIDDYPCSDCYNEMLGLPVNPTKWEARDKP